MSKHLPEQVEYEVWRHHQRGADVRVSRGMGKYDAERDLAICEKDKAELYPDFPVWFYIVRATTTRERITPPTAEPDERTAP